MNKSSSSSLIDAIRNIIEESRNAVVKQVNTVMVFTYFHIGKSIVEHEQGGEERASYSLETLKQLSVHLTREYGKGYSDHLPRLKLTTQSRTKLTRVNRTKLTTPEDRKFVLI